MTRNLTAAYFTLVIAAGVLLGTGLVPDWGQWYSNHLAYRWQTEALLSGSLSLGTEPGYLVWDTVWANGNVQQGWGLGAPLWRLPFEAGARIFGQETFPDRIAFGLAWASLVFLLLRLFVIPSKPADPLAWIKERPEAVCAFVVLALFPPLLTMCRSRFFVYEEAAAYSFLAGVGLFAGILCFFRRPTLRVFLVLAALAGLAPFVRPTLLAYGVTTMLLALFCAWRLGWTYRRMGIGIALFCLGVGLLFASNHQRFGSALEFGHSLNLNNIDSMRFTSRFDHPYRSEPLGAALTELTSTLFVAGNTFTGYQWYEEGLVPGQSSTHRWRELYFKTYDPSFALMLVIAWGWGTWRKLKVKREKEEGGEERRGEASSEARCCGSERAGFGGALIRSETDLMVAWSLIATVPIFLFYLRPPFIASRYLLDFGPAFAVGVAAFVFLAARFARTRMRSANRAGVIVVTAFGIWWGWQVFSADGAFGPGRVITQGELTARMAAGRGDVSEVSLPDGYSTGMEVENEWPPYNAAGWDLETGRTQAAVTLFIPGVSRLAIEVAPAEGAELAPEDYEKIRAKVGLEFLERTRIEETDEGRRIVFAGPEREIYRNGMQTAFFGFASADTVTNGDSDFRLLRVEWEEGR